MRSALANRIWLLSALSVALAVGASCSDSNQHPGTGGAGGTNGGAGTSPPSGGAAGMAGAAGSAGVAGGAGVAGFGGVAGMTSVSGGGGAAGSGTGGSSSIGAGGYVGGQWSTATPPTCATAGGSGPPVRLVANTTLLLDGSPVSGARLYAGDLNGDQRPDLVVGSFADSHSSDVGPPVLTVLLNGGAGAFAAAVTYALTARPVALAAGDMDGDGDTDLVVALVSGSVSVLLNRGDGTFAQPVDYPSGETYAFSVVLADVDGDHDLDVVVGADQRYVVRFANAGNGTLGAPTRDLANSDEVDVDPIAAGDLDGDGVDDLVATTYRGLLVRASRTGALSTVLLDYAIVDVAVGDLNGDGVPDLVGTGATGVFILLNDGQASFSSAGTFPAATSVAIADVTGDGQADIVSAGTDVTTVLVNDGGGSFHDAYPDGYAPLEGLVTTGDLNGDGWIDLVGTSSTNPVGGVEIALNQGLGTFIAGLEGGPIGHAFSAMSLGDLDGDGDLDVAVTDSSGSGLTVLLNAGDGTFAPGISQAVGGAMDAVATGDLDGDGDLDLIVSGWSVVNVLLNDGTGVFSVTPYPGSRAPASIATGDINGDGALDFVLSATDKIGFDTYTPGGMWVFSNSGSGTFTLTGQVTASVSIAGLADVNGDHALDLVASTANASFDVRLNDGHGNFSVPTRYLYAGSLVNRVADLNGDGKADVILGGAVALNDGSGSFFPPVSHGNGLQTISVLGDLDGDGRLDLVQDMGGLTVFTNNGCGEFTQGPSYALSLGYPEGGDKAAIGDMNGDGKGDLVILYNSGVSVLLSASP